MPGATDTVGLIDDQEVVEPGLAQLDRHAVAGQFWLQPAVKAAPAVLLAGAAFTHPVGRERRWLIGALVGSAAGDFLLAMPWWEPSFVLGLGAFLVAHLCFLAALLPLCSSSAPRLTAAAVVVAACVARCSSGSGPTSSPKAWPYR